MPEIVLFNPSVRHIYKCLGSPVFPPIGLVALGTVLKEAGLHVRILDQNIKNMDDAFLLEDLRDCFLAGVSITTTTMKPGLELATQLKRLHPDIKIVMGGVHVTLKPEDVMRSPAVDYAVEGEGEYVLLELARSLLEGNEPGDIHGLWRRHPDRTPKQGPPRQHIQDLDALPVPDFSIIERMAANYPSTLSGHVLPLFTSRGCPGKCTFCSEPLLWEGKWRMRSAEKVVQDFKTLQTRYGVREIHIWDDNFVTNRKRVREIASLMKKECIKLRFAFPNGVRIDCIDEEILGVLREMGTYSIGIGIESGNQEILDQMCKDIALEKIERTFEILRKLRFETWAFFLLGMPNETEETIKQTIDLAIKLNPNVAMFHLLMPYPGCQVTTELIERGLLINPNYEEYGLHLTPVHRTVSLTAEQLHYWVRIAYKRFYLRPRKIFSESLRMVRSWYRIKLILPVVFDLLFFRIFGKD